MRLQHLTYIILSIITAVILSMPEQANAGYNYHLYTHQTLAAESTQGGRSHRGGKYIVMNPHTGKALGKIDTRTFADPHPCDLDPIHDADWFFLDKKHNTPDTDLTLLGISFFDGYIELRDTDDRRIYLDPSTGWLTTSSPSSHSGAISSFSIAIAPDGTCTISPLGADGWTLVHDPGTDRVKMARNSQSNLRIYYRDPCMFDFADPSTPLADDHTITIAHSMWITESLTDIHYLLNNGHRPTIQEMAAAPSLTVDIPVTTPYAHRSTFTIDHDRKATHLWLMPRKNEDIIDGGYIFGDGLIFEGHLTDQAVTSPGQNHYSEPQPQGPPGQPVDFTRDRDVKIYYTLDGSDPDIPPLEDSPTHDLDKAPLIYPPSGQIDIRFKALKPGWRPSATTAIVSTPDTPDDPSALTSPTSPTSPTTPTTYTDLHGRKTTPPLTPGIYITTWKGTTRKIIVP